MPQHRIHVGALRQRLGQRLEVEVDQRLCSVRVVDTRISDEPVTGSLTLESIERGVSVTGAISVPWQGECRRCLEPVTGVAEAFVDEIFQVHAPPDSDIIDFDGDTVVLDQVIRDNAMASLPLSPLCRPDCQGPDPDRYPPGLEGERPGLRESDRRSSDDVPAALDPRWAALDQLDL
jgi:uncharacterized protein